MVWSPGAVAVEFRDVLQRHCFQCYSLFFDTLLARYTEVKYQLTQYFYTSFSFDKLLSETYLIFLYSYHVFSKSLWWFFRRIHGGNNGPLPNFIFIALHF